MVIGTLMPYLSRGLVREGMGHQPPKGLMIYIFSTCTIFHSISRLAQISLEEVGM